MLNPTWSHSKYCPSAHMHFFPQYCHCLNHIWKFSSVMAVRPAVACCWISSNEAKVTFQSSFDSQNGPEVTHRARAGEYDGWVSVGIPFFTKEPMRSKAGDARSSCFSLMLDIPLCYIYIYIYIYIYTHTHTQWVKKGCQHN